MKILTVWQPWAFYVAAGLKPVENRRWAPTSYRGPIAIQAGVNVDRDAATPDDLAAFTQAGGFDALWRPGRDPAGPPLLALGAVIAVARLTGCHHNTGGDCPACDGLCSPWAWPGRVHWQLSSVRALAEPVPARGMPGLNDPPPGLAEEIGRQLGAHPGPPPGATLC